MNTGDTTIEEKPDAALVTDDEHDAGLKVLEVERRSGRKETIVIRALSRREAQTAVLEMQRAGSTDPVLRRALKEGTLELLDRLTPNSAAEVENIAIELAFGREFKKKLDQMGRGLMRAMLATPSAPSSSSSAADTAPPMSEPGASPSSESGSMPAKKSP